MNERMKLWLDQELRAYETTMQEFRKKVNKTVYIIMALCVAGMLLLGLFLAISSGENVSMVFRIHLPVGCGIAVLVWFVFWCQGKAVKMEKLKSVCEKNIAEYFQSDEKREIFLTQMENKQYGRISYMDFMNTLYDKSPTQFTAGADYFMILCDAGFVFIRVSDIQNIYVKEEKSRVRYSVGDSRVSQNVTMGVSLVMEYKEGTNDDTKLYLHSMKQISETVALIRKHCPTSAEFMGTV